MPNYRLLRTLSDVAALAFGVVLLFWTLLPIYNMVAVSVAGHDDVYGNAILPMHPSLRGYRVVVTQGHWYLQYFWRQFGNSIFLAAMTVVLTLVIASMTSFSIQRMRLRHGWVISNAALLTYLVPASFLAIPFFRLMAAYGMLDHVSAVIAGEVAFATPYAILILQEYGRNIPLELDEAARIDGASPLQIYFRIYLPLIAPALVAVGTYALFLAWNGFLLQFLLLSSMRNMTVPVVLVQFISSDEVRWNYMMAMAIIYSLPPVVVYYLFRRRMVSGLTMGGVKG